MDDDSPFGCLLGLVFVIPGFFQAAGHAFVALLEGIYAAGQWVKRTAGSLLRRR